jgi:thiazole biosynthesis enzyme
MTDLRETEISRSILVAYHEKLEGRLESDVVVVGAGPSGMMAAIRLARGGAKVTVLEKRLSPGGGIWGGGMAMNEAVVQSEALEVLDEVSVRHRTLRGGLYTVDTIELASALILAAVQEGAVFLNLVTVEDLCVHRETVTGVVANRSLIGETFPVDPIVFSGRAVIDATGHDAALANMMRGRGRLLDAPRTQRGGEGPMDAAAGEAFVVDNSGELFPGLWVSGMSVCAVLGGPRMGPIFGGMLRSGRRTADLILRALEIPR